MMNEFNDFFQRAFAYSPRMRWLKTNVRYTFIHDLPDISTYVHDPSEASSIEDNDERQDDPSTT